MKNIIALLTLSTLLTACGGKSSNSSGKSSSPLVAFPALTVNTLTDQQKRELANRMYLNLPTGPGTSKVTNTAGQDISQDTFETGTVRFEAINKVETEIVLRVDAGQIYKYKIEENRAKNLRQVSVILAADDRRELEQEIVTSNVALNGDVVTFSKESFQNQITTVISGTTRVSTPCNVDLRFGVRSFTITTRSGRVDVPAFSQRIVSACGRTWSRQELRSLDLRNVSFCDERRGDDNTYCESRDMSYLTQGL